MSKTKPFIIPKQLVMRAYQLVKENAGSAGVDQQSLCDFEKDLKNNLYKIWNRMSSGTYFPPPVKAVSIPKKTEEHDLLMKAIRKHTDNSWVTLYIERWLKALMQMPDGTLIEHHKGTPQGGVVSPVLSNLFLHYVFDVWMGKYDKDIPWCRYADDGLVHCKTEHEAQALLTALKQRFADCGLDLHPEKTKIIYCKDGKRRKLYQNTKFTFLGYDFCPRQSKNHQINCVFMSFSPAVSKTAAKSMRKMVRQSGVRYRSDLSLEEIAKWYNPILRGWINYYGVYNRSGLRQVMRHFDLTLLAWAMQK
nr:reverse transcriptase domain-containing protein [Candidatus Paracaedibacter symbiosus]